MQLRSASILAPDPHKIKSLDEKDPMPQNGRSLIVKLLIPRGRCHFAGEPECGAESLQDIIDSLPKDAFSQLIAATLKEHGIMSYSNFRRSRTRQALFGGGYLDQPRLSQYHPWTEEMPRENVSSMVQDVLLADVISAAGNKNLRSNLHITRAGLETTSRTVLAAQVLRSMDKPLKRIPAVLTNVPSPRLDEMYATPPLFAVEKDVLRRTFLTANIGPYGSFMDLHHDDAHGTQTLTSGRKLWFFFPPTPSNLAALRLSYISVTNSGASVSAVTSPARRFLEASSGKYSHLDAIPGNLKGKASQVDPPKLSSGIALVQTVNTNIWVPPFCPHAVFTLQSSVLVGRELYLARTLSQRIEQVDLFNAYEACERDTGKCQAAWVGDLIDHMRAILNTSKDRSKAATTKKGQKRKRQDTETVPQDSKVEHLPGPPGQPEPGTYNNSQGTAERLFLSWSYQSNNILTLFQTIEKMPDTTKTDMQKMAKKVTGFWRGFLDLPDVQAWKKCPACSTILNNVNWANHLWKRHLVPCHSWNGWAF